MKLTLFAFLSVLPLAAQPVRIGTIHKPSVVVAWYNSQTWAETVRAKRAEQAAARGANDSARVDELEKWGRTHQELAHKQLAGDAPIDDILAALRPALPEVARKANVAAIVPDVEYAGPGVETVDVTGQILDVLGSSEKTRKVVQELRAVKGPVHVH